MFPQVCDDDLELFHIPLYLRHMPVPTWRVVFCVRKVEAKRVHLPAFGKRPDQRFVVSASNKQPSTISCILQQREIDRFL